MTMDPQSTPRTAQPLSLPLPPHILVVDDNPVTRYSTVRVLNGAGFRITEAECGLDALRLAMTPGISVVVLDINLPDIDGIQVCERLRADPDTATLPVVHLSATYVQDYDKARGLNAGATAYLVHPAEPEVLIATVSALARASAAERSLRESEARLRAIYQQAASGICVLDANGQLVDVNPAMLTLLRRPATDLVGQPVTALAPPEFAPRAAEATVAAHQGWQGSFPLLDAEGAPVHLDWSISSATPSGDRVAVVTDATERIRLEHQQEQLIEREQAARAGVERLNRMKDEFIAILSHELRNPLNVISVWTHVLGRHVSNEEGRRGLAAVERNVAIQQRLVADLVDVSLLNVGKMKLEREMANPAAVIRAALDSMQLMAGEKQLSLEADIAPDLVPAAWIDPARFQQILWNLISNAIKSSPEGATVRVSAKSDADTLSLSVVDAGRGIDPEFLPFLFDRFTQSEGANRRGHGGLGLGLAIVKRIAEMHGGTVQACSEGTGRGATFEITIPLLAPTAEPDDDEATGGASHGAPETPTRLDGLDIVLVEDDSDAAAALSTILAGFGAHVRTARDGDDALAQLANAMPDLIISDIGLPGRDGNELVREVRAQEVVASRARVPAIALTAFTRQQDRRLAIESGFDAVCAKPLRLQELISAIEMALPGGKYG
ncbi:hybrid sensor histidine kinase/response regulator [Cupriavidus sp. TA19]|uniref:hybrid sensor histidine kinase/response regulator n=1 Tax=Cupriavidus sp. TA19 TaxID=701108 RepID=UPI0027294015|nr:response regulator [Cupriavidus sp. TA19]GLC96873.1 hybrid sensor histidine kinase/response regulator [Cupriavidus sp. TA19]